MFILHLDIVQKRTVIVKGNECQIEIKFEEMVNKVEHYL